VRIEFVASVAVITSDPAASRALYIDALGLPLKQLDGDYYASEEGGGCKHFGVWPLAQAAEACFGVPPWPDDASRRQVTLDAERGRRRTGSSVRLTLVRHGDAHAGFHGLVPGLRGCGGLTDLGRRQAASLRDYLSSHDRVKADVLVASTLPRAIETAQIIAPALGFEEVEQHCDLCEVHTGEADGLEWAEYGTRYGTFMMQDEPDRVFAPQGESWNS